MLIDGVAIKAYEKRGITLSHHSNETGKRFHWAKCKDQLNLTLLRWRKLPVSAERKRATGSRQDLRGSLEREWASTAPTKCRGFRQDHYYKNQLRYRVNEERGEVKSGGKNA